MSSNQIVLFDLASRDDNKCWSPNPWKTRLLLNYKGLDYKTEFIEYPEIKPTLEAHVEPDASGKYTIPTVKFPDGKYVMDSQAIAVEIEKRYPEKPVEVETAYLTKLQAIAPGIRKPFFPNFVYKVPSRILNKASVPYFHETRVKQFPGEKPLDIVEKELGGDKGYAEAAPYVHQVAQLLQENPDGPFFEGQKITYCDFLWVGMLQFCKRLGDDVYDKFVGEDKKVHDAILEACQPWLKRDNY